MMKGLTLDEFKQIVEFVQKHHRFAMYIDEKEREVRKREFPNLPSDYGFGIKYIDSCYDSRDQTIWSITFRSGRMGVRFGANHFNSLQLPPKNWKYKTLYELCMAYLTGEFKNLTGFEIDTQKD